MLYALTRFEFANSTGDDSFFYDGRPVIMGVFSSQDKAYAHIEKESKEFNRIVTPDPYMDEMYGVPYLHLRDATTSSGNHYSSGMLFYITFLDYIADGATTVYYLYKDDLTYPLYYDNRQDVDEQITYYRNRAGIRYDKFTSGKKKGREVYYARHNQDYMVVEQIPVNRYFEGGL